MQRWVLASLLAACWPLAGCAAGTAIRRGLGLPAIFLAPLVFAAGSLAAYGVFWAYFLDPVAGRSAWTLLLLANAGWLVRRLWRLRGERRTLERDAWMPFALTALVTVACLGYFEWPGVSASNRFTFPLPVADHLAPHLLAERVAAGIRNEPRPSSSSRRSAPGSFSSTRCIPGPSSTPRPSS